MPKIASRLMLTLLLGIILVNAIFSKNHVERGLPHRQDWELYKQANSPAKGKCPSGTLPLYIINDDQSALFLECQRSNSND